MRHFCKILLGKGECCPTLFHYIHQFHSLT
nr:MAG TPA: hypothetical protein [Caudoviricetes sp.]